MSLLVDIRFHELENITNNFSEEQKVGSGPYGDVYKGVYNGEEIAVKKLHQIQGLDDKEFDNHFRNLSKIDHPNVARLTGYCYELRKKYVLNNGSLILATVLERALCYEYMQGGSLDKYISDESCSLDWPTCYKIIKGACKGLHHSHNAGERPIFHLDLKPTNILLDKNMRAKIGDLGLSRLLHSTDDFETESMEGTQGYLPPEYIDSGLISKTFDVYSLGVIIIKILAGNRGHSLHIELPPEQFVELVTDNWKERMQDTLGHSSQEISMLQVKACVDIALRCVHADRKRRPYIKDIINELGELKSKIKKMVPSDQSKDRIGLQVAQKSPELYTAAVGGESRKKIRSKMSLVDFKLKVLEDITDNFSEKHKIGSGGYADIYKGVYIGEEIAVKKLHQLQGLDDKEFDNEIRNLIDIDHKNIIRLIGYCYELQKKYVQHNGELILATVMERAICFEYMQGRSLDRYISDESCDLDWPKCYKIIKGICEGLNHLHNLREKPIFHMDLKPADILLDKNMTAKIGDLGLSLLVNSTEEFKTDIIRGTGGYMPPEYIDSGIISMKSDVFSFGVIIMKIMAGNNCYSRFYESTPEQFVELITKIWNWKERLRGKSGHSSQEINNLQVKACVDIALRCIQADRNRRPYITDVINELEELESRIKKMPLEERIPSKMSLVGNIELHMLETITNNFSEERKVGSGGYGDVYKGLYHGKEFAVKKLHTLQGLDDKVFDSVFCDLRDICHPNVVFLHGYCYELRRKFIQHNGKFVFADEMERALCFEYMRGGSLDKYISDESCVLDWLTCYKIIKGTCEGLNHLHSAQGNPIFHLDLKPSKILLDENMTAKIGDLGISRLVASLHTNTDIWNETVGYKPPEYINFGTVSEKFDVFSLGIIIMQIMAGSKGYSQNYELSTEQLVKLVTNNWKGRLGGTSAHSSQEINILQMKACVDIALKCIHADPNMRPYIKDIVNELGELDSATEKMLLASNQSNDQIGLKEERIQPNISLGEEIKLHVLEAITNNFSKEHKIGSGGYGDVYMGVYYGEEIVVKKLHQLQVLDDKEFDNEFRNHRGIDHKNVVRLIGYCYELRKKYVQYNGQLMLATLSERALCFEYMQSGSLANYISDESCDLDWPTCYKIIKGTCEGLNHLHNAHGKHIFHMDLKPAHIFLDKNMTAKLGDLSLSKLLADSTEEFKTEPVSGTLGYMPPEYIDSGIISNKFDVFSLGVIIMNILAGSRGRFLHNELTHDQFLELVTKNWNWKETLRCASGHSSQEINILQLEACVDIASRCIDADRNRRPCIKDILNDLEQLESMIKKMPLPSDQPEDKIGLQGLNISLSLAKKASMSQEERIQSNTSLVGQIKLYMLETITDNFSEERKVGSGGNGDVYKGLYNGKEFAVKKLHFLRGYDYKEMDSIFRDIGDIHHPNIVSLIGYCNESQRQFVQHKGVSVLVRRKGQATLCYEYMRGGSLEKHISDESCDLDWPTCYKIIKGISEGLDHLHSARGRPIFHLDLKPSNVLLDECMTAKIGDLGLSRFLASSNDDETVTRHGTLGYMPPEYINYGTISDKFDVFSLGVIIMKIMAGNKGYSQGYELPLQQFVKHVTGNWNERLQGTSGYSSQEINILQLKACVDIALSCVHDNPNRRPCVKDIVNELEELEAKVKKMSISSDESKDRSGQQALERNIQLDILDRIVDGSDEPKYLHLSLLQNITEYFNEKRRIGVGGCGEVYKGILPNGVIVAVKRLSKSSTIKDKMFDREIKTLLKARHENIVRFLGYCSLTEEHLVESKFGTVKAEIRERLLCLDYISNGSLDGHLTDELRGLEWHKRYEIIVGICNGLLYLHKENIIHMDLKPANILLDSLMVPKITDFGLSRFENDYSQTAIASRLVSLGYCAPEYLMEGEWSCKSDIYSLGVIIIELMTGSRKKPQITKVLRRWRHRWIQSSNHSPLGYQQVKKCLDLADRCTQQDPTSRPDMSDIINDLEIGDSKDDQLQVIPCLEDMLGIEPLEIKFPNEPDQQISHTIELSNDTDDYFAFTTKTSLQHLRTEPNKGIVQPRSKCRVTVTIMKVQAMAVPNIRYEDEKITVLSTRVHGGLADATDITGDMFIEKEGKMVDEVNVMVVIGKPPLAEES